jgi:hypothetical protein
MLEEEKKNELVNLSIGFTISPFVVNLPPLPISINIRREKAERWQVVNIYYVHFPTH